MAPVKKNIGRLPMNFGDYDSTKAYGKKNRCFQYGCEVESKVENNTYPPFSWDGAETFVLDDAHWLLVSGNPEVWAAGNPKPATSEQYPYNGMGRVVLKKNIVDGVNILTHEAFEDSEGNDRENTIFVIQYDFTLGEDITVPGNCILEFDGGSISASGSNDTITGANTSISSGLVKIFNTDVILAGTWNINKWNVNWFGAKGDGTTDNGTFLNSALNNIPMGSVVYLPEGEYKTSTSIIWAYRHLCLSKNAKISATAPMDYLLYLNGNEEGATTNMWDYTCVSITGGTIDGGNYANIVIANRNSIEGTIENCVIYGGVSKCVCTNMGSTANTFFVRNCYLINENKDNKCIGIDTFADDALDNISMRGFNIGVRTNGNCKVRNVRPWLDHADGEFEDSICFDVKNSDALFSDCVVDTYKVGFNIAQDITCRIDNLTYMSNLSISGNKPTYLFKGNGNSRFECSSLSVYTNNYFIPIEDISKINWRSHIDTVNYNGNETIYTIEGITPFVVNNFLDKKSINSIGWINTPKYFKIVDHNIAENGLKTEIIIKGITNDNVTKYEIYSANNSNYWVYCNTINNNFSFFKSNNDLYIRLETGVDLMMACYGVNIPIFLPLDSIDNPTQIPIKYVSEVNAGNTRPTLDSSQVGFQFFDTSLTPQRPIYWTGSAWVDATGTPV